MDIVRRGAFLCLVLVASILAAQEPAVSDSQFGKPQAAVSQAEQLFALANQSRAAQGLAMLKWDPALAAAALQHCSRMAQERQIAHRYGGEPDLTARAGQAGAHFSLIEENVAVGGYPAGIHQGWMNSAGHRANLLNPEVDRVGVAVVARGEALYAVEDFARAVPVLTQTQIEANFAGMLRASGLAVLKNPVKARDYCASSGRLSGTDTPDFAMVWQNPDLTELPADLKKRVASGAYRRAAVGSCPARNVEGAFTMYRVAVLLYGTGAGAFGER